MRTLLEETAELLSRAKYMEEKHPNTSITPDYWTRLKSVCDQARLETINEAFHDSNTSASAQ